MTSTSRLAVELKRAVDRGDITGGQAVDALGEAQFAALGLNVTSRMTRYRHRRVLQDLGLVADLNVEDLGPVMETHEVDLALALEEALEADWSGVPSAGQN